MIKCDSHGPLVIHVAKLYAESDGQSFSAFGRIYSGTVKPGELWILLRDLLANFMTCSLNIL